MTHGYAVLVPQLDTGFSRSACGPAAGCLTTWPWQPRQKPSPRVATQVSRRTIKTGSRIQGHSARSGADARCHGSAAEPSASRLGSPRSHNRAGASTRPGCCTAAKSTPARWAPGTRPDQPVCPVVSWFVTHRRVRAAMASRAPELPPARRDQLTRDPRPIVRWGHCQQRRVRRPPLRLVVRAVTRLSEIRLTLSDTGDGELAWRQALGRSRRRLHRGQVRRDPRHSRPGGGLGRRHRLGDVTPGRQCDAAANDASTTHKRSDCHPQSRMIWTVCASRPRHHQPTPSRRSDSWSRLTSFTLRDRPSPGMRRASPPIWPRSPPLGAAGCGAQI